ncbi:unnamed protein product [Rotaria socialis]|uniref:C2H2-type domain-containing protein n=1 Tax=Rotaria socialis TaxID=392032 RepID=A0A817LPF5_9BILA|nr:unnamed protein product [Rotaria socialis]
MSPFSCPLCVSNRCFGSFAKMFQHITLYHQHEPNFNITCDLHNACGVLYRNYSAYKAHVYRRHASEVLLKNKPNNTSNVTPNESQQQESMNNLFMELGTINDCDNTCDPANDDIEAILIDDDCETNICNPELFFDSINADESFSEFLLIMKRSYLQFILELREEYLLPQGVTNIISTYIVTLFRHLEILLNKKAFIPSTNIYSSSTSLPEQNKKIIEIYQLHEIFNDLSNMIESISKNNYQFIKSCEKYFDFNLPEQVVLSSPNEPIESAYFIPIDRTLSLMLKSQRLLLEISENIQQQRISAENDSDLMYSIRDAHYGNRFDEDSFLIQLYLDDIGLTNPIGAKRDKHKMTMIYFSLEDVPDKYRSKLDFIQLVAVCESKHLKNDVKARRFFAPIIENLNKLQLHGISIHGVHLTFSFSTVVADNLASHFIGAFQSCFNGGHFCRRCYITYSEKNLPIPLSKIQTRSMIDHDDLVDKIINDPNRIPLKGVIGPSPLLELIGFHATTSLPRDLMHDFIEGICPVIIISLLKQASSLRILTYMRIQERMENFQYGKFDSSNQPPPLLVKHLQNDHMVATAAQKLCFFKLFPIIFNDTVDLLPSFIVYKVLREILDLILSYPFRKKWLYILGELCDTFHETMLSHFPEKITPKAHFIREYKYMINDFGPAVRQWCFRYEANHSYFKKITARTNNFKNIAKMLVTRYHLKQCLTFGHLSQLQSNKYSVGIKKARSTCFDSAMKVILLKHFDHADFDTDFYQCKTLVYDNVEYRRCGVHIIDLKPSHEQPIFGQIAMIIKKNEKWWLLIDVLDTICYDEKLFAWQIQSTARYSLIDPNNLVYYHKGLDIYMVNNLSFVSFISRLTLH